MTNLLHSLRRSGEGMIEDTAEFAGDEVGGAHHMSWSAVIAGALTALVAQLVLSLLGLGIGLSAAPGLKSFSIGAGVWIIVSAIAAYGIGGFIAGRLGGSLARSTAGYHGLVTWALTTVVAIVLVSTAAGAIVGGTFSALTGVFGGAGNAVSSAVKTVAPAVPGDPMSAVVDQVKAVAGDPKNADAGNDAVTAVKSALSSDPAQRAAATDQAAQALAKARGIPLDQAKSDVAKYEAQYDQLAAETKEKVGQVADTASTTASIGALVAAISLIIGALAAFLAGRLGAIGLGTRLVSAD